MPETLHIETDARGVATLMLNQSERHNAMSGTMMTELTEAAHTLGQDPAVRVVILTGAGHSFCAGADLRWMRAQVAASPDERAAEARRLAQMLGALNDLPKPLIGRINGQAFGGGLGLISVCDVALAADHARFAFTETRLGLIPATIAPYVLARMGEGMARRVFMSARRFDAAEARDLGLLAQAVPGPDLAEAVEAEVRPYLSCAPLAVAEAKALAKRLGPQIDAATIEHSIAALIHRWDSAEAQEGLSAFFDKRHPRWA